MEPEEACFYISFLFEKDLDEKLFARWISGNQFQMSFDEFKENLTPIKIQDENEIIKDVYSIIESMGGKNGGF